MFKTTKPLELDRAHRGSGRKIRMEVGSSDGRWELERRGLELGWRSESADLSLQMDGEYEGMNLQEE